MRPFDITGSATAIRDKTADIEWAPFASYIMADPQIARFDTGKKLVLILHVPGRHAGVWWTFAVAVLLEIAQLAEVSHQTSLPGSAGCCSIGTTPC